MVSRTLHELELFSLELPLQMLLKEGETLPLTYTPEFSRLRSRKLAFMHKLGIIDREANKILNTLPPGNDLIFQHNASFSGA